MSIKINEDSMTLEINGAAVEAAVRLDTVTRQRHGTSGSP